MSLHSIHIDSFDHTRARYANSAGMAVDPLVKGPHSTIVAPMFPVKREVTPDGSAALDSVVVYKFPTSGYLHSVCIKNKFGTTTTADMSDYPAYAAISKVEFRADNETLMQYDYHSVITYYLSQLPNEEAIDKHLLASGGVNCGTSSAAIWTMAPIPLFFDPVVGDGQPLNLGKFTKQPELHITYRSATACTKATGSGADLDTSRAVYYMTDATPSLKRRHLDNDYHHKSIDFNTLVNKAVADATETDIDVTGIKGQCKRLFLTLHTAADITTNYAYYALREIDYVKTDLDGAEDWQFRTKEEGELDYLTYNGNRGFNSTIGYPYVVPYGMHTQVNYASHNVGGIHSSQVNKHIVRLYQSAISAAAYLNVVGIRSAIYKYVDGGMIRLL